MTRHHGIRKWSLRLGLLVLGLLAVLLLLEAAFRIAGIGSDEPYFRPLTGGTPFVPSNVEGITALLPNPSTSFTLYGKTVHINSQGFRGPEPSSSDDRFFRVVALGDSYTFGWGLEEQETWPAQLAAHLNEKGRPARVYNLGLPNSNTEEQLLWLDRHAPGLRPQAVVLGLLVDDVLPHEDPMHLMRIRYTLKYHSHVVRWLLDLHYARSRVLATRNRLSPETRDTPDPGIALLRESYLPSAPARKRWESALKGISDRCRSWNCPLVVLVFPVTRRLAVDTYPMADLHPPIHDALRKLPGARVVDLLDHIERRDHPASEFQILPHDAHPRAWVYGAVVPACAEALGKR